MVEITFEDWKQLDLKVGRIVEAERVPKTAKLYRLQVEVGRERPVQIITSLVQYYSAEQLLGRKIIVLCNLRPTRFSGQVSEAMLLCAEKEDASQCVLLTVDQDIEAGTPVT